MPSPSNAELLSPDLPSGTVTFLFTDIEGSTELLKELGKKYKDLLVDQRSILRKVFTRWNGTEVDTQGDAFFVSFPRASEAVNACVEIQRALVEHAWPEEVEVRVRMGLHTGEPWSAEEGYIGMDVHRAARIAHVGHGGQVLLSETTTALILDELPEGVGLVDLGRHLLKDIPRPEHIRQLVIEGLPSEFPHLSSVEKLPLIELREPRQVGECPYQGLTAFLEEDADFFFGREDFTKRLIEAVETHPLIAVIVGSSGSGKSSAVFAGLIPQLRRKKGWSIAQFRPGSQPLNALMTALLPTLEPDLSPAERLVETRKLVEAVKSSELPLYDVVEQIFDMHEDIDRLLLVVDQFEELYTLCQDKELRGLFKDMLLDMVLATSGKRKKRFVLLLTLRADFMGQALMHRPFADALQEASLLMGPMTREELRAAVEKPAQMQGAAFEPGLVERILDDVGEKSGNLPLLEFALTLLWEAQTDGWLTHEDYEAIGCVEGALARYADEVFEVFEKVDQEQARRIFVQLVKPGEGTEDTRRVATKAELPEADWSLVQHLADKRLVVTGRSPDGDETVEVVHEALIQRWGQFQRWMREDREFRSWQERLRTSTRSWEASDRDERALLRGLPLTEAEKWQRGRGDELSPTEAEYIQASLGEREGRQKAEQERQARETRLERTRQRLARGLIGVLGIGLAVALGLVFYAFGQRNEARQNAVVALAEANARATAEVDALQEADARATAQADAEARKQDALLQASIGLSSQAALELQGRSPDRAVLLALEALENYPYTWQAERALGEAVFNNHLQLILEHEAWVNTALWSPDQSHILTASDDGSAKVWDANTGELLHTFVHEASLSSAIWSPSGDRILTYACSDPDVSDHVNLWDASTGSLIRSIQLEECGFLRADWSRDGKQILIANLTSNTRIWDALTGELILTLESPKVCSFYGCVGGIRAWSPSGDQILTHNTEGGFQIWDAESGGLLHEMQSNSSALYGGGAWSPSGSRVVTWGNEGALMIWDAATGRALQELIGHTGDIFLAAWSPSGEYLVSTDNQNFVRVWDTRTGAELLLFDEHDYHAEFATWSPSGEFIFTGSRDGSAKIWNAFTGEVTQTFLGHDAEVHFSYWSQDGRQVLTCSEDGRAIIWNVPGENERLEIPGVIGGEYALDWSPAGDQIVRAFGDGSIEIYDTNSGEQLRRIEAHEARVMWVAYSPTGEFIASTSEDGTAKVWDASTGKHIATYDGHIQSEFGVFSAEWSPDGGSIASTCYFPGCAVRIWDPLTGDERQVFSEHQGWGVIQARWSPDGTRIASSSGYGEVFIWNVSSGEVELSLYPEDNRFMPWAVAWSPDGNRLATHAQDGILRIWDSYSGEELIATPGHSALLASMGWHPSAERLLSGDSSGVFKMFDTQSGTEIFSVYLPTYTDLYLSPDGTQFATSSVPGGPIKIFTIWSTTEELMQIARECCVIRELTLEEREQFGLPLVEATDD